MHELIDKVPSTGLPAGKRGYQEFDGDAFRQRRYPGQEGIVKAS